MTDPVYNVPDRFQHLFAKRGDKQVTAQSLPAQAATAGGLMPHAGVMTTRTAAHLVRRAEFGASAERRSLMVGKPVSEVVQKMVNGAKLKALAAPPSWHQEYPPWGGTDAAIRRYNDIQFDWAIELGSNWLRQMIDGGLRERLMLFWHDHFATERGTYFYSIMAYKYLALLENNALGNFKDFTIRVGVDPAMLVYLDGRLSTAASPNENYARELLELFTMGEFDRDGKPNFTQEDIVELSRCLTGYRVDYGNFVSHRVWGRTDLGTKRLFGREGKYDFTGAHNIIFEERKRQIARFVCAKLYTELVYVTPNDEVVDQMADIFIDRRWDIAPVVEALLSSEHFYSEEVMGAQIKSPTAVYVGMIKDTRKDMPTPQGLNKVLRQMNHLSQRLFDPPNVAGWPGYRSWISTSSLSERWEQLQDAAFMARYAYGIDVVTVARTLVNPDDPMSVFKVPVALAEHLLAVPLEQLNIDAPAEFAGDLISYPLPDSIAQGPKHVRDLTKIFLGGMPWYDWQLSRPGISYGMYRYFNWLSALPEYQLT